MNCLNCGSSLIATNRFCPNCGAPVASSPIQSPGYSPPAQPGTQSPKTKSKWSAPKLIFLGCGVLILIGAGVTAVIFFGVRYAIRHSDAALFAEQTLRQSNAVRDALGTVVSVGTPSGTVRTAGSVGAGDLTMKVTGTKASGEFEAILERKAGKWTLITGQLTLTDGRIIYVEAPSSEASTAVNHGRQLATSPVDTQYWQQLTWQQQNISLRVPESWIQKEANQRQWDIRAGERYSSTYLMANAWIWERNLPAQNLVAAEAQTASEKLRNGIIEGYAIRSVGGVNGVLTISSVGDRLVATWNSIVPAGGEQKSVDISLGAPSREFSELEPTFSAIFDSIRFN